MNTFSDDEEERYSRHFVLPQFGAAGQQKLRRSAVAIVGAGGLGAPVISYLAAAGVGTLGIFDNDVVSLSNLQRQVLFNMGDLDKPKAACSREAALRLNPNLQVAAFQVRLDSSNALELLKNYDVIVDATDNFPTRYLLNDVSVLLSQPLVYGSVFRYEGQVSVFNCDGGPTYRDLYPEPPRPGTVPDCEEGGVLGVLPGIIGSIQASETIKLLTGIGELLSGRLLLLVTLTMESRVIQLPKNQNYVVRNLIDYEHFCGFKSKQGGKMKEVTAEELKALMNAKSDFQLIDVREEHEHEAHNLGGELIPMAQIPHSIGRISKDKQVILYCQSGSRSARITQWLESNHGFNNLYNLKGGILDWVRKVEH